MTVAERDLFKLFFGMVGFFQACIEIVKRQPVRAPCCGLCEVRKPWHTTNVHARRLRMLSFEHSCKLAAWKYVETAAT